MTMIYHFKMQKIIAELHQNNFYIMPIPAGNLYHFKIKTIQNGSEKVWENVYHFEKITEVIIMAYCHFHDKTLGNTTRFYNEAKEEGLPLGTFPLHPYNYTDYPDGERIYHNQINNQWQYYQGYVKSLRPHIGYLLKHGVFLGHIFGFMNQHRSEFQEQINQFIHEKENVQPGA